MKRLFLNLIDAYWFWLKFIMKIEE